MAVSHREETEKSEGRLSGAEWFRLFSGAVTGDIILLATTTVSLTSEVSLVSRRFQDVLL